MLEKYADYKVRIYAIGYSQDDEQYLSNLQTVANATGGVYYLISNKDGLGQIPSVWDNIAGRIKKQYVITGKLAELPDWGERIAGKDEANYAITVKVKMKDGATVEAGYNDVHMPLPSVNWTRYLKLAGMILGGILALVLVIVFFVFMARRKPAAAAEGGKREKQEYDGPSRGKLTVLQGPLAGEVFPLIDDVTTIGSMKGNTIIIQDGSVSRRHAAIKIDQMRYEVADMNSTNGVLVNGQKIHKIFLKDGDRVQIGTTEVIFTLK
jgi:preprotein translocase subunit YajC